MKNIEYRTVDKTNWPEGPWLKEPDKIQYQDPATGLPCLIVRGPVGALCGYVGVPEGHPAFGKHYDDEAVRQKNGEWIDVHGGLTFSDFCQPGSEADSICHVVEDGENDRVWWLGFDCAHGMDHAPSSEVALRKAAPGIYNDEYFAESRKHNKYRTVSYVKRQIRGLAKQLHAMS